MATKNRPAPIGPAPLLVTLVLGLWTSTARAEGVAIGSDAGGWARPELALVGLAAAALYVAHRWRLRLALHGERGRIARDLHDDVGAALAGLAMRAELLAARCEGLHPATGSVAAGLARTSRELLEDVGAVAWSLTAGDGRVEDLVARLRRCAGETLEARGIAFAFHAPAAKAPLASEAGRHAYLVFREALHNVTRHSRGRRVEVRIDLEDALLRIRVRDDGAGFDPAASCSGLGLRNMRARAARAGGSLEIDSGPGRGTSIVLRLPLRPPLRDLLRLGPSAPRSRPALTPTREAV